MALPAVLAVLAVLAGMVWWRWGLVGLVIASGIALVGGLIVWAVVMPGRLAPPVPTETLDEIKDAKARLEVTDARTRLHHDLRNGPFQWLTVVAVLIGAWLGFQQLAEDRDQASKDRNEAIQDRQLTRQGQASERFTRAIDQLGSRRMETRIGGIYGLSQIAEQSPEENIGPVGEVLLAWLNGRPRPDPTPTSPLSEHAPDVQAALTVLTGQRLSSILPYRLDLHGLGLRDVFLGGVDLSGANLDNADLRGANLDTTALAYADLDYADLRGAGLRGADLDRAHLYHADLRGADLRDANLYYADLRDAHLGGAELGGAVLGGADLRGVDLRGVDLRDALLGNADLRGAKVDGKTRWPRGFDWRRAGAEIAP
jgi:hypothetical protein